jgi:hypothetical protein
MEELRDMDALVMRDIMGWYQDAERRGTLSDWHEPKCGGEGHCAPHCGMYLPKPSTDISAAMLVVEKMREQDWFVEIANSSSGWYANFIYDINERKDCFAEAKLLPEAICRAALQAVEVREAAPPST